MRTIYRMRKRIAEIICLFALVLMGCNPESEYQTKPVEIELEVPDEQLTAGTVGVNIRPKDDRVYYYCNVMPAADFHHTNYSNFMTYVLDKAYRDYLDWRSSLLQTDIDYVATFASHCLSYGLDSRTFTGLKPETEYLVYAFCVNPDTRVQMGDLYMLRFTTRPYRESQMIFTYSIEHKEDGVWLTLEPSADTEPFIWDLVKDDEVEGKGLTPQGYVEQVAGMYHATGQTPVSSVYGFVPYNMSDFLSEGERYCLMVVGYNGDFTTGLYHADLLYSNQMEDVAHAEMEVIDLR